MWRFANERRAQVRDDGRRLRAAVAQLRREGVEQRGDVMDGHVHVSQSKFGNGRPPLNPQHAFALRLARRLTALARLPARQQAGGASIHPSITNSITN